MDWNEMSEWEKQEEMKAVSERLHITTDKAVELLSKALSDAKHEALEAVSDDGYTYDLYLLSIMAQAATEQQITAIKKDTATKDYTVFPASWGDPNDEMSDYYQQKLQWHQRRLTNSLLPSDPKPDQRETPCWYFVVNGNPIMVESWLKENGYKNAFAINKNTCIVQFIEEENA